MITDEMMMFVDRWHRDGCDRALQVVVAFIVGHGGRLRR